jgi:ABC-2 type transport system permease protein
MKFIYILIKDLKIFFKEPGAVIFALIVPIVVITISSFALGSMFKEDVNAILVPIVDHDQSNISKEIISGLKEIKAIKIEETYKEKGEEKKITEEWAREKLKERKRHGVIIIPKDFGSKIEKQEKAELLLLQDPTSPVIASIIREIAQRTVDRISAHDIAVMVALEEELLASERERGFLKKPPSVNPQEIIDRALSRSKELWQDQPVKLKIEDIQVTKVAMDPFTQYVPGFAVMFALMAAIYRAFSLFEEKEWGTFKRLLSAPLSAGSILFGKLLASFFIPFLQLWVFFAFGHFVFKMDLGNSLLALGFLISAVSLCSASLGIFSAALTKSRHTAEGILLFLILSMSALGGSWWPLEIVPDFMQKAAHVLTINAWAMDGFGELLWYGKGVFDILPECVILLVFAFLFFTIGLLRFRMR